MSLNVEVKGLDNLRSVLHTLEREARAEVKDALELAAEQVKEEAVRSVLQGRKSGRVYHYRRKKRAERGLPADKYFEVKGRKNRAGKPLVIPLMKREVPHQASAPGEAPAEDMGKMSRSIQVRMATDGLSGVVVARGMSLLEYGTRKVAARPFLFPALLRQRSAIFTTIDRSISKAIASADRKRRDAR